MPELPDIVVYLEALAPRVVGQVLQRLRLVLDLDRLITSAIERATQARLATL